MKEDPLLNVADVVIGSYANGPGKRVVIWVQGCTIGCEGCFNTSLQPHVAKNLVMPGMLAKLVIKLCKYHDCEGVTFTGGEPFQQSQSLSLFAETIKKNNLSVVCFSGYSDNKLLSSKDINVRSLLANVDILIAGPFNKNSKYNNRTWFDDPDKKLVFLTEVYSKDDIFQSDNVEYIIDGEDVHFSGFIDTIDLEIEKNIRGFDCIYQK